MKTLAFCIGALILLFIGLSFYPVSEKSDFYNSVIKMIVESSVLVQSEGSSGSGVCVKNKNITFVLTDAHVVRPAVKPEGFEDVWVTQHSYEFGRQTGYTTALAKLIRFDLEEDIAILQIRRTGWPRGSVKISREIPPIGAPIYCVGSMLGEPGINSLSEGLISCVGRLRRDNTPNFVSGFVWDQVTAIALPGSSGGGIFCRSTGDCLGLTVETLGSAAIPTFNVTCITPGRRLYDFVKRTHCEWVLDDSIPVPTESHFKPVMPVASD